MNLFANSYITEAKPQARENFEIGSNKSTWCCRRLLFWRYEGFIVRLLGAAGVCGWLPLVLGRMNRVMLCAGNVAANVVAGNREIGEAIDRVGGGELPDLRRSVADEVGEVDRCLRRTGKILADHHDGQRAVGGALGGEGGDVVGIRPRSRHTLVSPKVDLLPS